MSNKKQSSIKSDIVIARIKAAAKNGIKIRTIAEHSGITYFRIASVVNTKSYRQCTTFTDSEAADINRILDTIKAAL